MPEAEHYCHSCGTHFNADPEDHSETYHDGGVWEGVVNGNYKDFERRTGRRSRFKGGDPDRHI